MVTSRLNHVSVLAHDLEESTTFYEEVFGMERVPAPNFPSAEVQWLRVGDLTLHLFERQELDPVGNYHFGLWVDDFEEVYRIAEERDLFADFGSDRADVYELPEGALQMYVNDPVGNLVEVNHHDVDDLDRSSLGEILKRSDQVEQTGEAAEARLFFEEFLADLPE
jgi:catechol 2,3-dioxygenase-like lactoylglutathione lyase family enzyme